MGAYINGDYKSEYSGDQIDAAIGKVRTPDSTPTASSDNLVTSGGVKAALDQKQAVIEDLSTIRSNATDGKAAYDKIDEGLAKSDLDAGVQASLDKADAAAPQSTTYTKTEVDNALATKAAKNGSGSEDFNAKSVILPTTGVGSGTSQILGANSPVPGRYYLPDSASGGQGYTLATTDMVNQKANKDTDAVEGNLAEFDANGNPVDSGIPSTKIGEIEEEVSVLRNSAGIAEGIADTISAGTAQEFVFRKSGGDGVNYMKRIKGRSIVWNQIVNMSLAYTEVGGLTFTLNSDKTITINGTTTQAFGVSIFIANTVIDAIPAGRKVLWRNKTISGSVTVPTGSVKFGTGYGGYVLNLNESKIIDESDGKDKQGIVLYCDEGVTFSNLRIAFNLVGLTLMFGPGNEPSTVAEFEALYPESYYPYNAGSVESNDASEIETVGRNVWDEETKVVGTNLQSKNLIPVFPNTAYYITMLSFPDHYHNKYFYNSVGEQIDIDTSDAQSFITPANCAYMSFTLNSDYGTTYNHDICINLSDPNFNGQYEPYWKRRIELNLSTLKDKDGNLVFPYGGMHGTGTAFDSMKPEADGFIHYANRVFKKVDLGTLIWTKYTAVEEGHHTSFAAYVTDAKTFAIGTRPNIICDKYVTVQNVYYSDLMAENMAIQLYPNYGRIIIRDDSKNGLTAEQFKAAVDGIYAFYELAAPIEYELAEPIPNAILVDSYGTEKAIFPVHEDGSPSAPFCCDSNYSISVKNLVAKLNALNG